jgi:hypothetical protein
MKISAVVKNYEGQHQIKLQTNKNVHYRAKVTAKASEEDIPVLIEQTDRLTETQNTLRRGTPVVLTGIEAVSV